jgi:uncharacterized integral membrane protein
MRKLSLKQIVNIIAIALCLAFVAQNLESVQVYFLFFGFELPLVLIIAISFFIGYFTSQAFSINSIDKKDQPCSNKDEAKGNTSSTQSNLNIN